MIACCAMSLEHCRTAEEALAIPLAENWERLSASESGLDHASAVPC